MDKEYADIGDEITYTIEVTNTGNVDAQNIIITDSIPSGTSYVANSLSINGALNGSNPEDGISLVNPIIPGGIATIIFKVLVNEIPTPNPILNKAEIEYSYKVDPTSTNSTMKNGETNEVQTQVNQADLIGENGENFVKSVDKEYVTLGEEITYTILVSNTGSANANNVVIKDIISSGGIYIANSLTIDGIESSENPEIGIVLIDPIVPSDIVVIDFKVLIEEIPLPNPILNKASIDYDYKVDPTSDIDKAISGESNIVETLVSKADLIGETGENFIKLVDKEYVDIGDEITYTLVIKNTGNVDANSVKIIDSIPSGASYIANTLIIDNVPNSSNPEMGIILSNPISSGQTILIKFKVLVEELPVLNPMVNEAELEYNYTIDPQNPNSEFEKGKSNEVLTKVNNAELVGENGENFIKAVDKEFADIGDELTYEIMIGNTGNVNANNVVIQDTIPISTSFVNGSLKINGVASSINPEEGIELINPIEPNQIVELIFKVVVEEIPVTNPIENKAQIEYNYTVNPNQPNGVKKIGETNNVETLVKAAIIGKDNVAKFANKDETVAGDIIEYQILIENIGNIEAKNIIVTDSLPKGVSFINNSVKIDGNPTTKNPVTGIEIEMLLGNDDMLITFDVKVLDDIVEDSLKNTAIINYEYEVEPNKEPIKKEVLTNEVIVDILVPSIEIIKIADRKAGIVGDIIRYTITSINTGDVELFDVIIQDELQIDLKYIGNLTINKILVINADIEDGVNIGTLEVNEINNISFDVEIVNIPTSEKIVNYANAAFDYKVDKKKFEGFEISDEVVIDVFNPDFEIIKEVDDEILIVDDIFTYTVKIKNTGNIILEDFILSDSIPSELNLIDIKLDGVSISGDLEYGINIGDIEVAQVRIVEIVLQGIKMLNDFENIVKGIGHSSPDINKPSSKLEKEATANKRINVYKAGMTLEKLAKVTYSVVGDEFEYNILVTNIGNIKLGENGLYEIIIYDELDSNLLFIEGSLKIDNIPMQNISIAGGINIGELNIGHSKVVSFKVKVLSDDKNIVQNCATSEYKFILPNENFIRCEKTKSNIVEVCIKRVNLNITKEADVTEVGLDDVITYTITMFNDGNLKASNIIFKDILDYNIEFVEGSFRVEDRKINVIDIESGINIGSLDILESIKISYKTIVISTNCSGKIENKVNAQFNYSFPDGSCGVKDFEDTEATNIINSRISTFKQLSIESNLELPIDKPSIETINEINGKINILGCHIVETSKGTSQEGQRLTGYKLIVRACLDVIFNYTSLTETQAVHSAHYKIPFSHFVILPKNFIVGSTINAEGEIEDIYYKLYDKRKIFTNATLLLDIKVGNCN